MGLNDIQNEFSDDISAMAEDLNNSLPLSKPQLRAAFTDNQIADLHRLVSEVNAAATQNQKIAKLQDNAKTALLLLKKLGVAL